MSELVIANTGPIIALALIDRLDIPRSLWGKLIVPESVHREILAGGSTGLGLTAYRDATWIEVKSITRPPEPLLVGMLHAGEAQVIQLACELGARTILMDESKARKIARDIYGFNVIGSARVLVEAKHRGLLDNVGHALQEIQASGYWIADHIVTFARRQAGEL